jgi:flagellar hook-length control protein FliK
VPQVASDSTIQAANRQLPRPARPPQQPDRAPSPFESLLDDTPPPDDTPVPVSADNKASAPENSQPSARTDGTKIDGTKTAVQNDDATPAKPDGTTGIDQKKPADSDKVADNGKAAESAAASSDVADSTETDGDHKAQADQKTDNSSAVTKNDAVLTVTTSQTIAATPVPVVTSPAGPAVTNQPEPSAQQASLAVDVAAQLKQFNPDQPKISAGKNADDGKLTDSNKTGDSDSQTIETLTGDAQLSAKGTKPAQADDKSQHAASDADKQLNAQARGETPIGGHQPDTNAKATPQVDANVPVPQITNDTLMQQTTVTAATQAADVTAASANPLSQPGPQAVAIPLSDLAVEIAGKALAGKNRFEIRLDPPELGRIEVRLDVDRDGNVTSRLTVDRADTLSLLQRDASGLERALQDAGLKTTDNSLQFSLRDQSMGQQQGSGNSDSAQLIVRDETLPTIDLIPQTYGRLAGQGSGLDIRV